MNWNEYLFDENEKPLDRLVGGYSYTSVFRKIGFIGDSLSSGEFETLDEEGKKHFHDLFEYSWGQYIARKNGLTGYNFSRGGMTAKEYMESFAEANGYWDPALACQAYVIALGVNDLFGRKQPLGSLDDVDFDNYENNNRETFAGCYAYIIQRLKKTQPRARFFLMSMPRGNDDREDLRKAHADFLNQLAEKFDKTYVIDLNKYAPVYDEEFRELFYLGHMTPAGYMVTAKMVASYMDYIIRHNMKDFKQVGFIGTDLYYEEEK